MNIDLSGGGQVRGQQAIVSDGGPCSSFLLGSISGSLVLSRGLGSTICSYLVLF